jgi:hypothetical protein
VARPPNGGRTHRRGAQGSASGTLPSLALVGRWSRSTALRRVSGVRAERKNEARVCARAVERGFVRPETSRSRWIEMDGSRSPDRVSAQAGRDFPGPGPGCGLERGTRGARAGRWTGFHLGPHGGLARGARSEEEWATGRFRLWAASRPGARSEFCASRPWAVFHFRAEFRSEQ